MGQWLSKLWPEAPNPSLVEIEARQRAEADAKQARKDVEAAQAEFTALIQSNQESQKKAMEDKLAAMQAAQEQAHKEMMAKVEAERAANEAAQAQTHKEMMAMIQAEKAVNEARLMAETATQAANEEARQRAAAEEEERKRTAIAQVQVERDARQLRAHEEMMVTMEAEWAAREARLKAETAAREEEKQRAAVEAEEEQKRTAAIQEQAKQDAQEHARKVEEAAKEDKRKTDEAADALRKEAEEKVNKANAAREDAERKLKEEVKRAEEDAERKLKVEVKKANDAERKLKEGIQPMVTPTPEEVRDTKQRVQYCEDCFHLAVAGAAGGGKSSLINAFRGLRNNDSGAAATGVTETTMAITRYANPNEDHPYVWYDIPGAGTSKIPDWLYFNAQGLYIFDCIIVMFDSRFTMADIAILINCRRFNIPMYIVRSKADQHIRNLMEDLTVGYGFEDGDKDRDQMKKLYQTARKMFIQETRQCVKNNLEDANIPDQKVYIVSKETMVGVVKEKRPKEVIDEIELLNDLVWEGQARRGQRDAGAVTVIKDMLQSITSI